MNRVTVESTNAATSSREIESTVSAAAPSYAFLGSHGLSGSAFTEVGGTPLAGAHPFSVQLSAYVPVTVLGGEGPFQQIVPSDRLRQLSLELPAGLVINPLATARCSHSELEGEGKIPHAGCPAESQVGRIYYSLLGGLEAASEPLYNMAPDPGVPAEFAFQILGTGIYISPHCDQLGSLD